MRVHSFDPQSLVRLSDALRAREDVVQFTLAPAGD
jgi:hypothetical protein